MATKDDESATAPCKTVETKKLYAKLKGIAAQRADVYSYDAALIKMKEFFEPHTKEIFGLYWYYLAKEHKDFYKKLRELKTKPDKGTEFEYRQLFGGDKIDDYYKGGRQSLAICSEVFEGFMPIIDAYVAYIQHEISA